LVILISDNDGDIVIAAAVVTENGTCGCLTEFTNFSPAQLK